MYKPRQILAYGTLSTFLIFVLFYGFADAPTKMYPVGTRYSWRPLDSLKIHKDSNTPFPDFSRYEPLKKLSSNEFPIDDPIRRVIIVGDIHGMMHSLEELLKRVKYSPSRDVLVHSGDIVAKGPHTGSLAVLNYMASNNVTGVRGNHDQKIIEWRGWLNWVSSIHGATDWLDTLENRWHEAQAEGVALPLKSWLKKQRKSCSKKESVWWKLVPEDWIIFSDHYKIAQDMSEKDFLYLLKLPLRLYIPSAHAFIVHAGLLPSDPNYPAHDKSRQPLAAMPSLPQRQRPTPQGVGSILGENLAEDGDNTPASSSETIKNLRYIQEIGILTQIPQNADPWVVLNMRSVVGGQVSRKSKGTPWSKIWEENMENCVGFNQELEQQSIDKGYDLYSNGDGKQDMDSYSSGKKLNLMCYPSTTVYGHTASRGLDIKRWSFGLDSGCVYERRLSALVIQGRTESFRQQSEPGIDNTFSEDIDAEDPSDDVAEDDEDEDDNSVYALRKKHHSLPFGDFNRATVVSVKCRLSSA